MPTWWNDIRRIERYLLAQLADEEKQHCDNPNPGHDKLQVTQLVLHAIRWYGRRKLRREIKQLHQRLLEEQPGGALARELRAIFPERERE